MKIALLTSYPLNVALGSGIVRMLQGFASAFRNLGQRCTIIHPRRAAADFKQFSAQRLEFNRQLQEKELGSYDLVIGSDFDGFSVDPAGVKDYLVLNGGLLADVARFEKGENREVLLMQAEKEKINAQKARLVFVPSKYSARMLTRYYQIPEEKIRVVPLGVNLKEWASLADKSAPPAKKGQTILCVARQYARKGIPDLIQAFDYLLQKEPALRLDLVGGGPEMEHDMQLAKDLQLSEKVRFYGDVSDRKTLAAIYKKSALFCLPSHHETFGLVFLEAMAFGLPVVGYNAAAVAEVVGKENGFLVKPGAISELAGRMEELLTDKNLAVWMGRNGYLKAKEMSWQRSAASFLEAALKE